MRKIIIYHQKHYSNYIHLKRRARTKEFWINVIFIALIVFGFIFLVMKGEDLGKKTVYSLSGGMILACILMFKYITHLERRTPYFVNDNEDYRKELEKKLIEDFKITKVSQLDVVINSIIEERDKNVKKLGIAIPYIAMGITLIALFSNASNLDVKITAIICIVFFVLIFILHALLKFFELFFNLYSDNLSNLINILKQIKIAWLAKGGKSEVKKIKRYSRRSGI